jgi:hypothetical protein
MAKATYKLGLVTVLALGLAISASGQRRGFSAPARGFSAPIHSFPGAGRGSVTPRRAPVAMAPGVFRRGFFPPFAATPLNPNFVPINGVPGLGFDFPHLAAVSRGFRHRFPFTNNGLFSSFTPIFFDPLPLYYPSEAGIPEYYSETEQQPILVMTPPPQQQPATPPAETAPRTPAVTPGIPAPPPPELGQLILVRRDGQVLMAVAFTTNHGQLTYITREGLRRSFPITELDKDSTRQMNDANGTSVSIPE